MGFRVVCISRSLGAGGELIGQAIAPRLGFQYVDEQIIEKAASQAQVDASVVAATEHRQPLLQRLLDKLALASEVVGPVGWASGIPLEAIVPVAASQRSVPDDLRAMIRYSIHEVARQGNAVIVAHAASMALAGVEGVLRVLVTASPEVRSARVAAAQGTTAAAAAAVIATSDRERRDYFQRFYNIKEELPTHYDLVINTDVLTPELGVELIQLVAQRSV
jgi:cytidylate kinase